jgi:RND family efflux transporter MFP subunit
MNSIITMSLLGLVLLFANGCSEEVVEQPAVARPVKLLLVGNGTGGAGAIEYPGKVEAAQNSEMAFEVSGKIIEFPVDEGQRVEQGTVLARLDPRDFENSAAAARAEMERAKAFRDRVLQAAKSEAVSRQEVTDAEARYRKAVAEAAIGNKAEDDSVLRATFSGVVAKKVVADFANVQAKQVVLILQDDSYLEIEINFPERDLRYITPGLSVEERTKRMNPEIIVTAFPERRFSASLKSMATTADPVTRTFSATFRFANPDDITIRPGMTAKVVITPSPDSAAGALNQPLRVPADAVIADDTDQAYVWRLDVASMTVDRVAVKMGELSGSDVEVLEGLDDGDTIAISGVYQLQQGMKVRRFGDEAASSGK